LNDTESEFDAKTLRPRPQTFLQAKYKSRGSGRGQTSGLETRPQDGLSPYGSTEASDVTDQSKIPSRPGTGAGVVYFLPPASYIGLIANTVLPAVEEMYDAGSTGWASRVFVDRNNRKSIIVAGASTRSFHQRTDDRSSSNLLAAGESRHRRPTDGRTSSEGRRVFAHVMRPVNTGREIDLSCQCQTWTVQNWLDLFSALAWRRRM